MTAQHPLRDRFLRACRGEAVDATPVWFMRQAGRYLPEYREARGARDLLVAVRDPESVVEITLQPLRRFDADAAILFSDIMVPIQAAGVDVRIERGVGPVVGDPIRSLAGVDRLRPYDPDEHAPWVGRAVEALVGELKVPLIGFAGAPFTLASYLIEGSPSRDQRRTKALMRAHPEAWARLMDRLAEIVLAHLRAQVAAGCAAVQLFDSWAGSLDPADYERSVLPWSRRVLEGLADMGVPRIHFGVGTGELLPLMGEGAEVVGVDWRVPLDAAWERVGRDRAIQGNLDPTACIGPWEVCESKALEVLERAGGRDGHIFNLGHGVLPESDPDNLGRLVDLVHERTAR